PILKYATMALATSAGFVGCCAVPTTTVPNTPRARTATTVRTTFALSNISIYLLWFEFVLMFDGWSLAAPCKAGAKLTLCTVLLWGQGAAIIEALTPNPSPVGHYGRGVPKGRGEGLHLGRG
ncbi:MAG: hypothetical protein ACK4HB_06900, partial [Candidatus Bipolaricaulia bacterium]